VYQGRKDTWMRNESALWQKLFAECMGTGLLVLFGAGAFTATFTIRGTSRLVSEADLGIAALSFAIIIAAVIYAVGRISGGHLNPAITVGLAVRNHIGWPTAGAYIVAQFVGAFIGALGIALFFGRSAATSGFLGVPSYATPTSTYQAFFAEAIGTFVLVFAVYGLAVDREAPTGWAGLIIGLVVGGVIMVIGPVTGGSINPARAFGPMLAQTAFGGPNLLGQFWVYLIAPLVGGIVAAFTYEWVTAQVRRPTAIPAGPEVSERDRSARFPEPPDTDIGGAAHA
jgi:glycerol uptake facilitator protein